MRIATALREGVTRLLVGWRWILLAHAASLALALPLAAVVRSTIAQSLGHSTAAERLRDGWDHRWYQGFAATTDGLAATFDPGAVGIGAVLGGFDAWLGGRLWHQDAAVVAIGVFYALFWVVLAAGLVAWYATPARVSFSSGAARFAGRFLGLAAIGWALYAVLFGFVLPAMSDIVDRLNRDTIDERVHFAWVVGKYVSVWSLAWMISVVIDYAKIASVLMPNDTLPAALVRSVRLVFRRPARIFGLSAVLIVIAASTVFAYGLVAPGVGQSTWSTVLGAFAIGQALILSRITVRCLTWACHTAMADALLPDS